MAWSCITKKKTDNWLKTLNAVRYVITITTLFKSQGHKAELNIALLVGETRNQRNQMKCLSLVRGENQSSQGKSSMRRVCNKGAKKLNSVQYKLNPDHIGDGI